MSEEKRDYKTFILDDTEYKTTYTKKFANKDGYTAPDPKKIYATIPGTTREIFVKVGDKVEKGEKLIAFDAMKMHNKVFAPRPGKVKTIYVEKDKAFKMKALLMVLE